MNLKPPFTTETAIAKVRKAEDAWNTRDAVAVSKAYSIDTQWRNRSEIFSGRDAVVEFLSRKWESELEYRLIKELWSHGIDQISVRFQYEYHNAAGDWFRAYGNEQWRFDSEGLMKRREASINDIAISEEERKFFWDAPGARPASHAGLSDLES